MDFVIKMVRTSTYDTLQWVKSLYQQGIREFIRSDLPDTPEKQKYFKKATSRIFIKIGTQRYQHSTVTKWKIPDNIMNMNVMGVK